MRVGPTLLAAILVLLSSSAVQAQDRSEEARTHFQQGVELYEEGKFDQASAAFETAYKLKPSYKILYNIGQVENELGHYAAALEAYTVYLAEGGVEIAQDRLKKVKAEIKRLNALVGMLVIQGGEDGAVVLVDRVEQGRLPLAGPVFVDLGTHDVAVELGGERLLDRVVKVGGGERVVLQVEAAATEEAKAAGPSDPSDPSDMSDDEGPVRVWTWVAAGVGGAAGIGAAITGGVLSSKASDLDESCEDQVCPGTEEGTLDSAKTLATTADVLLVVAGVGVATAVVLFFVEPGLHENEAQVAAAPVVLPGGGGVAVGGTF